MLKTPNMGHLPNHEIGIDIVNFLRPISFGRHHLGIKRLHLNILHFHHLRLSQVWMQMMRSGLFSMTFKTMINSTSSRPPSCSRAKGPRGQGAKEGVTEPRTGIEMHTTFLKKWDEKWHWSPQSLVSTSMC